MRRRLTGRNKKYLARRFYALDNEVEADDIIQSDDIVESEELVGSNQNERANKNWPLTGEERKEIAARLVKLAKYLVR